jgi:DNA-binding NtrC family response regulator
MTHLSGAPDHLETVLVVDDDNEMRDTLAEVLRMEGIETITAGRVDDALKLVAIHTPAVVVADYQLPDGTGIDLAHEVKAHDPEIPVLLLTGYATLDTAIASVGQLDAYLIKPVAPPQFQKSVADALARRRLFKQNRELEDRLKRINAYQAMYDPLTGLLNRALLDDRLSTTSSAITSATGCCRWSRSD